MGCVLAELDDDARPVVLPVVAALTQAADALTTGPRTSLDAVAAVRRLTEGVESLMPLAVTRARAAEQSWASIGAALGTSRQAAFQRFGRTGAHMSGDESDEAVTRATELLSALAAGDFDGVHDAFDTDMAESLDATRLRGVWAEVTGMVGQFERLGHGHARRIGEHVVVDVPLVFEAGEMVGRIALDHDQRVAGLFVRRPQAE